MSLFKREGIPFAIVGMDGRFVAPPGAKLIPCPECQTETGHTGECSLSTMKTGCYWLCLAVPIDLMRAEGGGDDSGWPSRDDHATQVMKP